MNNDEIKADNDTTLKALMQTILDNDKSDEPLLAAELLTEFAIKSGKFNELANYVEYNIERRRLLDKYMTDFRLCAADFAWGGSDYGFSAGTWTNAGLGEAEDRIMPKLAESLIEMHNTFIKYHPNFKQTKLVRNDADLRFGMKYETTDGNEDIKNIYGDILNILYLFFYKRSFESFCTSNSN